MIAYCVKCKVKRTMTSPKNVTMKNGRKMVTGRCPNCKTRMSVFA